MRMYLRPEDRVRPSRMALRIAVVGGVGVALFAVLFFRLWTLQVLDGAENLAEAKNNRTRSFEIIAPRGKILARNGEVLVDNRTSLALQVDTTKLPEEPAAEAAELKELGSLVHMDLEHVRKALAEGEAVAAGAPITLRRDVGYDLIYYIEEHKGKFPGVSVEKVFVRNYPDETRAAHVLGSTGEVSEEELEEPPYEGLEPGEIVGQGGVEYTYDKFLRGTPGISRYQVNALGEPTPGGRLTSTPPTPGDNLKLTINPAVQAAGEGALAARGPGAFVTMNVHSGEVLGMGSFPTYDPTELTPPLSQAQVDNLFRNPEDPLTNRAVEGLYPTGSTFKLITAMASLNSGVSTPETRIDDPGSITIGEQKFEDSEGVGYGDVDLVEALKYSSDVYFYTLGDEMWQTNDLQDWAHRLGIGRSTGIDLPQAEGSEGLVPGKQWAEEEIAAGNEFVEPWGPGQNVQLATGQGYLQTDPLEMAVAYATVANGGTVVTPHLGEEIEDPAGRVLKEFDPGPRRHVHVDPAYRAAILEGLHEAAQSQGGTSCSSFCEFPIEVGGKTGTAERVGHAYNQSWYLVLAPYPNPQIVTAVTIEEGGFGAESAAPAAKEILEAYFGHQLKEEAEEETETEVGIGEEEAVLEEAGEVG
ncbi:MAG TPA: penicillin-binding protein 2 [Solirubrobacterales bacterium]|nr:penicillin-binding protein 2 [Solirubrobacterales bacterium]